MDRYLVVANQTATSPALDRAIGERIARGPCFFHVVVPCTGASDLARYFALVSETVPGYIGSFTEAVFEGPSPQERASARLADQLTRLTELGATSTGEVGDEDPMLAIGSALADASAAAEPYVYTEIVLSTLPASISRWINMDLPNRVRRRFSLSVVVVETKESELGSTLP